MSITSDYNVFFFFLLDPQRFDLKTTFRESKKEVDSCIADDYSYTLRMLLFRQEKKTQLFHSKLFTVC